MSLTELLVALLIIAVLVAVAIGTYSGLRARAQDREAMMALRTAQVALELRFHQQLDYAATVADLEAIEPALRDAPRLRVTGDAAGYEASVQSRAGDSGGGRFTIAHRLGERVRRTCEHADQGGCRADGSW